jgi:hypothetical protein
MDADAIRRLISELPPDSPYPEDTGAGRSDSRQLREARLAICLPDPAFGANFVKSFVRLKQSLPPGVPKMLQRAYVYLACRAPDRMLPHVWTLAHPASLRQQRIIKALLVSRDVTLEKIGQWVSLPTEVVEAYEQLFFNVRDRWDEPTYIAGLVFPRTRLAEFDPDAGSLKDDGARLLRAGYEYGAAEVCFLAGLSPCRAGDLTAGTKLESLVMDKALTQGRHGGANCQVAPALERGRSLLAIRKKGAQIGRCPDDIMGLGAISIAHSAMDALMRQQAPDIKRRLELQEQEAAKKS